MTSCVSTPTYLFLGVIGGVVGSQISNLLLMRSEGLAARDAETQMKLNLAVTGILFVAWISLIYVITSDSLTDFLPKFGVLSLLFSAGMLWNYQNFVENAQFMQITIGSIGFMYLVIVLLVWANHSVGFRDEWFGVASVMFGLTIVGLGVANMIPQINDLDKKKHPTLDIHFKNGWYGTLGLLIFQGLVLAWFAYTKGKPSPPLRNNYNKPF